MIMKLIIMFILIVIAFKPDMAQGGRGIKISNVKAIYQPQNFPGFEITGQPISPGFLLFPGFPNSNFPGQPRKPNNIPGFSTFLNFLGFQPIGSGGGDPSLPQPPGYILPLPLFPFFPYFRYGLPKFCIRYIGCIPLRKSPPTPPPCQCQCPHVQPPPSQTPIQDPPLGSSPLQPPPVQSPPSRTPPAQLPLAQIPAVQPTPVSPVAQPPIIQTPRA